MMIAKTALIAIVCLKAGICFASQDYQQAIGLIHMDSEVSGGENSLGMLAAVARNAGADMAIVTDHDTQKATYGIWPLRKLIRISHSRASVRKYGISGYLDEIAGVDRNMADFDFLPGIEAVPYYRWEHNALQKRVILKSLHRHMLVMGLESPSDIEHLPSIEAGYPSRFTRNSLTGLLWLIPLLAAFLMFRPPDEHHILYNSRLSRLFAHQMNLIALPLMAVSVVFLVNGFPFREQMIDQYGPDAGAEPYQEVIEYVNSRGGLVFWAHPEASYIQRISPGQEGNPFFRFAAGMLLQDGLDVVTEPYYDLLNSTVDYTGFAIFFEGYRHVGNPEGIWDALLMQFCNGTRGKPVWAISEIDMEHGTDPETASASQTVFLVREKTKEEYLEALRTGRVYCYTDNLTGSVTIRDYSVTSAGKNAISGEIVRYENDAVLTLDMDVRKHDLALTVAIIKDGSLLVRRDYDGSEPLIIPLAEPENDMGYVRAAIFRGDRMVIATNPIFYVK